MTTVSFLKDSPTPLPQVGNLGKNDFKDIFQLVYRDQLEQAYHKLNAWSIAETQNQPLPTGRQTPHPPEESPGSNNRVHKDRRIFNLMKLIQYCLDSVPFSTVQNLAPGDERYQFWQEQWNLFEEFVKRQSIYNQGNYLGMKNYFYQKMIDNLILEFNSQSHYNPIMLETCKKLLEIGSFEKAEEGFSYLIKNAPKLQAEIQIQLVEILHYREKNSEACLALKDLLFHHPRIDISKISIPQVKALIQELFLDGFSQREIQIWLGVFLRIRKILPIFYSLSSEDYKQAVIHVSRWEKSEYENEETYHAILIYRYLYIMDQIYTRVAKGKTYLKEDLDNYLEKLKQVDHFIYQQVYTHYGIR